MTHKYERIFRFVSGGALGDDIVAMLDVPSNVLHIDREAFTTMGAHEQRALMRTDKPLTRR